ncbi:uncharacterized protein LOC129610241 isoform X2 [Condylostylus longicornis]|nr:uncharacterized protein LOC129610241 isoform X2 [Condylostylus longicornis]XP_055378717.1 uncharacterized protein LOC129610241 isoform X2 [Condylostylus longicornis]
MNYKKNRITKMAVPTLTILYEDDEGKVALDYETSDFPEPKRIPLPTAAHLIPPVVGRRVSNSLKHKLTEDEPKIINSKIQLLQKNVVCFNLNKNKEISGIEIVKTDTVESQSKENVGWDNFDVEIENCLSKLTNETSDNEKKISGMTEGVFLAETVEIENNEHYSINKSVEDKDDSIKRIEVLKKELESNKLLINELKDFVEKIQADSETENEVLRKQLELKESEIVKLKGQISAQNKPNKTLIPLTKEKLFQSIKKYVCPSMSSLIRMEMFGSSEREWEIDEKERAKELLQLGESVFFYFRDEWRFRLPPQKDVEKWLLEN